MLPKSAAVLVGDDSFFFEASFGAQPCTGGNLPSFASSQILLGLQLSLWHSQKVLAPSWVHLALPPSWSLEAVHNVAVGMALHLAVGEVELLRELLRAGNLLALPWAVQQVAWHPLGFEWAIHHGVVAGQVAWHPLGWQWAVHRGVAAGHPLQRVVRRGLLLLLRLRVGHPLAVQRWS